MPLVKQVVGCQSVYCFGQPELSAECRKSSNRATKTTLLVIIRFCSIGIGEETIVGTGIPSGI